MFCSSPRGISEDTRRSFVTSTRADAFAGSVAEETEPNPTNTVTFAMKKGCLIAIISVVAVIAAIVALVFGMTSGVVKASDEFLALLGSGKVPEAYQSASPSLRVQQAQEAFEKSVKDLGLTDFASSSWSSRGITNDQGYVEGTVTTKSRGAIPLRMDLVKEGGTWRVYSLSAPKAGAAAEKSAHTVPSDTELKALTLDSLMAFNKGIQAKSFVEFHKGISIVWQKQITPQQLAEAFRTFVEKELDLTPIQSLTPAFDSPASVNSDGVLILAGAYPTEPSKVHFTLKYVAENFAWKLVGINVDIK